MPSRAAAWLPEKEESAARASGKDFGLAEQQKRSDRRAVPPQVQDGPSPCGQSRWLLVLRDSDGIFAGWRCRRHGPDWSTAPGLAGSIARTDSRTGSYRAKESRALDAGGIGRCASKSKRAVCLWCTAA